MRTLSTATTEKHTFQPKWIGTKCKGQKDPTTCGKLNT